MPQVPCVTPQGSRPLILISLCREKPDLNQTVEACPDRFISLVCPSG